jgi:hypothetical protein
MLIIKLGLEKNMIKLIKSWRLLFFIFILLGYQVSSYADDYEWYWGGDVLPRDYNEYCKPLELATACNQLCTGNGYTFPNNSGGDVPGGAYCKQLVTHYKIWCSCDISQPKYPSCTLTAGSCHPQFIVGTGNAQQCSDQTICGGGTATCNYEGVWSGNICMQGGHTQCICNNTGQG